MPGAERLQKLLARAGFASRRAAEKLILGGRVTVNGEVVRELGTRADAAVDDVRLDGERLRDERKLYLALHKPTGFVTTLDDPHGRPTVRDLMPKGAERVFPVGRLDFATAGLLLLTNDGELAARLLHPRYGVPRVYRAKVSGRPTPGVLANLRRGVRLEDGVTGPAEVEVDESLPNKTWLRITVREGKRREVRRMCDAVGLPVDKLLRVSFGPVQLGDLRPGEGRSLAPIEIERLRDLVGLDDGSRPRRPRKPRVAVDAKPQAKPVGKTARRPRRRGSSA